MDGFNSDNLRFVENRLTELSNPQGDIDDNNSFRMSNVVVTEDGKAFWIDTRMSDIVVTEDGKAFWTGPNLLPDESKHDGSGYTRQIETMIFPCDPDGRNIDFREVYRGRYNSVEEAVNGHNSAIKDLSKSLEVPPLTISADTISFNTKPNKDYFLIKEYAYAYGNNPDGFIKYLSDEITSFNNDNSELTFNKKLSQKFQTPIFTLDSMSSWAKEFNLYFSDNFVIHDPIYLKLDLEKNELNIINSNVGLVLPNVTTFPIPEKARSEIILEFQRYAKQHVTSILEGGKTMDVTRFEDKLSDNSLKNLIDIDSSAWEDPETTYAQLNDIFDHLETDAEHKIELINMGSRSEPDLFICATLPEMKDEFIVKISQEGRLEFDPQILTRSKDVVKEAAETEMSGIAEELPDMSEEDIQVATDMLKESMEKVPEKEFIGDKSVDEFLKDTVSDLENRGLNPDIAKSLTKELIPEKGNKEMRNQLKSDIKELKESIDKLTKEVRQELGVAKINGLNKDTAENINNKVTAIAALTEKHAILKEKLEQNTPTLAESIKEFGAKAGRAITKTIDNIDKTLDAKIQNGKTALERIGSSIRDCNNKAFAGLETAYTGLEERVAQIHRGFLVNDYIHSKNELEHLNKLHDTLEHRFDRFNEIKRAFTNLGHAISGKEQNYDVIQYSEKQQAALSSVEAQIADVKEEITSISQEYNISKSISEYNLESTKDLRRGYGLKECKTLDEMIGKIKSLDKAADDKMNKHAPEKSGKEAKSRNDDDGARTR